MKKLLIGIVIGLLIAPGFFAIETLSWVIPQCGWPIFMDLSLPTPDISDGIYYRIGAHNCGNSHYEAFASWRLI